MRAFERVALHPGVNEIQVQAPRCGSARIRVLGPGSVPLDRHTPVELCLERLDLPGSSWLDDDERSRDGGFLVRKLSPGRYRVAVVERSLALVARRERASAMKATPVELTVKAGETTEAELVLTAER